MGSITLQVVCRSLRGRTRNDYKLFNSQQVRGVELDCRHFNRGRAGMYKILGAILVAALVVDFIWVIRTALSVH
jgi:hypothetical protein